MGKLFNRKEDNEKRRKLRQEMPKAEVLLWWELKGKKQNGHKFRRQYGIGSYVVDFYCPEVKLAIEIDGATHITDEEIKHDKQRQVILEKLGIKFLRFTNPEIYDDLFNVLEKIKAKVDDIKATTPAPLLAKEGT